MKKPVKIFIIYARKDARYMKELRSQLTSLELAGVADVWCDCEIDPGVDWETDILNNLEKSDIIMPLVSAAYFESAYIRDKEMKFALRLHEEKKAVLVPVILRPCNFRIDPVLGKIQVLPTDAKPVTTENTKSGREQTWVEIAGAIEYIARKIRSRSNENKLQLFNYDVVLVEGGTYSMGNRGLFSHETSDECPHDVSITSFKIGKFPVTQIQWEAVMGNNPSHFKSSPDCPVENVSWFDVHNFIKTIKQKTGMNYRLPTEKEWEYAARGGRQSSGLVYSGSNDLDKVGWFLFNSGNQTHPVGGKEPNELGIYDMSGNVWEWCADWHTPYPGCSGDNYTNRRRVGRGGSWQDKPFNCRSSNRGGMGPANAVNFLGFRLVLET
jgi:formylglycine-generating enzyme required for sulfatase activity